MTTQAEHIKQLAKAKRRAFKALTRKIRGRHKPLGVKLLGAYAVDERHQGPSWIK